MTETQASIDADTEIRSADHAQQVASEVRAAFEHDAPEAAQLATGLRRVAEVLEDSRTSLVALTAAETRLTTTRLEGELTRTTSQLRLFADQTERGAFLDPTIDTATTGTPAAPDVRRINVPLGPVAIFAASNFPFAFGVPGGDFASALATGCPIIMRGHPSHPSTGATAASLIAGALAHAGFSADWFRYAQGPRELGRWLVQADGVAAVAFTGSQGGGRALMGYAAQRTEPIPVFAEMGSLNPLLITSAAAGGRGAAIAEGLTASITGSAGQLCTKPGVILVPAEHASNVLGPLEQALQAWPGADMLDERISLGFRDASGRLARFDGVRVAVASRLAGDGNTAALFVVDEKHVRAEPAMLAEIFGPAAVVVICADDQSMLQTARTLPASLTVTLHSEPAEAQLRRQITRSLASSCGRFVFNGYPTGVRVGHATVHGGPSPATSDSRFTSVGTEATRRFLRPFAYQDCPDDLLPAALRNANPTGMIRRLDATASTASISAPAAAQPAVREVGKTG